MEFGSLCRGLLRLFRDSTQESFDGPVHFRRFSVANDYLAGKWLYFQQDYDLAKKLWVNLSRSIPTFRRL